MALTIKDRVKGGDGYRSSLDKFDPKEVAMGLRVELEHTDDLEVALDIVRDHLSVYPKYYTRLKKAGLADELEEDDSKNKAIMVQAVTDVDPSTARKEHLTSIVKDFHSKVSDYKKKQ